MCVCVCVWGGLFFKGSIFFKQKVFTVGTFITFHTYTIKVNCRKAGRKLFNLQSFTLVKSIWLWSMSPRKISAGSFLFMGRTTPASPALFSLMHTRKLRGGSWLAGRSRGPSGT